ncbi:MAG: acyltransferase family protein [Kiloniellales bacterium]
MGYRPDIDGLRALAVIAVVLFHLDTVGFSGGFVGVDVFFVISGYLITRIIAAACDRGDFSFKQFYLNRINRLFPALFVVLFFSTLASLFVMLPGDAVNFGRSLAATALFVANLFFEDRFNYFGGGPHEQPLLHTWSLSVEEQFYLIWPLLLVLLLPRVPKTHRFAVVGGVALGSLALSQWLVFTAPSEAFYLLQSRAWEFMFGALVAFAPFARPSQRQCEIYGLLGLFLILSSLVLLDRDALFPGIAAVAACLGAALLIYGSAAGDTRAARLLSRRPMVFLGEISYSLYLWHWPLIVFWSYAFSAAPAGFTALAIFATSIGLAWLSWRYVECPFRGATATLRLNLRQGFAAIALVIAFGFALHAGNGWRWRLPEETLRIADSAWMHLASHSCLRLEEAASNESDCQFGVVDGEDTFDIVIWGDSHGNHYVPTIAGLAERRGWHGRQITASTCLPIFAIRYRTDRSEYDCDGLGEAMDAFLDRNGTVRVAVLAARWARYTEATHSRFETIRPLILTDGSDGEHSQETSRLLFESSLQATIGRLRLRGIKVILMGQVPVTDFSTAQCHAMAVQLGRSSSHCGAMRSEVAERFSFSEAVLARLAGRNAGVVYFPAWELLCDEGERCRSIVDGAPLYADDDHLSSTGARYLGELLELTLAGVLAPVERDTTR